MPSRSQRRVSALNFSVGTFQSSCLPGSVGGATKATEDASNRSIASSADAMELLSRMQDRTKEIQKAEKDVDARESLVKTRYTGGVAAASGDGGIGVAGTFDKTALLADMIAEARHNFLKLDQTLSEDYNIATRRLHAAVFGHTSDFLQLFRDVNRASSLVESLKSSVQGTKAVISAISKSATCERKGSVAGEGSDTSVSAVVGLSMFSNNIGYVQGTSGDALGQGVKPRARPSLIAAYLARRQPRGGLTRVLRGQPHKVMCVSGCGAGCNNSVSRSASGRGWSRGDGCLPVTTRSLNTTSVNLWQTMIMVSDESATGDSSVGCRHRWAMRRYSVGECDEKVERAKTQDIAVFVDVLRQEVTQAIAERRYVETAELLRSSEAEAEAKGCLSLLLELEEQLVHSIKMHVQTLVMPLMYSESLHIPLIQLLLKFGRVQCGSQLFFHLHAVWLDAEMEKLQLRLDPYKGTLIASDFLVSAILEVLERQKNLWCTIPSIVNVGSLACGDNGGGATSVSSLKPSDRMAGKLGAAAKGTSADSDNGGRRAECGAIPRMPPSSTAVLWVHDRLDKFAREVLQPRALSYGTGAEGGNPSRFRRAVVMAADAIRTVRRLDQFGFAGCDTRLLVLLTPSLMYLQTDFCRCTESRLATTGKAMIEHLIHDVRHMYRTKGKGYDVKVCGEVARRNNSCCRELQHRLRILPWTPYALLAELLLAPASSRFFVSQGMSTSSPRQGAPSRCPTLMTEHYGFLRYSNGCTRVHGLLLASVLSFVAAMTGDDVLPLELAKQQAQEAVERLAGQAECVSFLLSNSLVIESLDVTLHSLFLSLIHTTMQQRQTLVRFMLSDEFSGMNPKISNCRSRSSSSTPALVGNPWALSAMQLMLADVLSTAAWIAYLSRGGALPQLLLLQSAQAFRVQYVEELRHSLPSIVQGWMVSTVSLGYHVDSAQDLLLCNSSPLSLCEPVASSVPLAGLAAREAADTRDPRKAIAQLLEMSAVNESRLTPFLLSLVQNAFTTRTNCVEEASLFCAASTVPSPPIWCLRSKLGSYPRFPIGTKFNHDDELFLFHLFVQIMLNVLSYFQEHLLTPSYVVNERWVSADRKALGNDCSPRQSRGGPSKWRPSRGCVSPQTESVIAALSAGGGNYVSAVALLQFIVYRLLRDVLCRPQTWNVVYGFTSSGDQWPENVVRQQAFFFALFVRFWSPLFAGGGRYAMTASHSPASGGCRDADSTSPLLILQWLTCAVRRQGKEQRDNGAGAFDIEGLVFPSNSVESRERADVLSVGLSSVQDHKSFSNQPPRGVVGIAGSGGSPLDSTSGSEFSPACSPRERCDDFSMLMLCAITSFFEAQGESRAVPAITSDLMRKRVEKVMSSLNLLGFVNNEDPSGEDDAGEGGEDEKGGEVEAGEREETTGHHDEEPKDQTLRRSASLDSKNETRDETITLSDVHSMLLHYLAPLMYVGRN